MAMAIKKPYVIYLAEIIYKNIEEIKKKNLDISNIDAIEKFIGSELYENISSGKFHDNWFSNLENNKFIDKDSGIAIKESNYQETITALSDAINKVFQKSSLVSRGGARARFENQFRWDVRGEQLKRIYSDLLK